MAYDFVYYFRIYGFDAWNIIETNNIDLLLFPEKYRKNIVCSKDIIIETEDIVIYPETVPGNPLKGNRIIRHILNRINALPNYYGCQFGKEDFLVSYNSAIDSTIPILNCIRDESTIFSSIRNMSHCRENKIAVYFGKIRYEILEKNELFIKTILKQYENVIITRKNPQDRVEMLKILREVKFLISFDALSNINYECTLLGTPVLLLDDFFHLQNEMEICHYGYAFEYSELAKAEKNADDAWLEYLDRIKKQGSDFYGIINKAISHFERLKNDKLYHEEWSNYITNYLKSDSGSHFENIDYASNIPLFIRQKMGIKTKGGSIKSEIKFLLYKLGIYEFIYRKVVEHRSNKNRKVLE